MKEVFIKDIEELRRYTFDKSKGVSIEAYYKKIPYYDRAIGSLDKAVSAFLPYVVQDVMLCDGIVSWSKTDSTKGLWAYTNCDMFFELEADAVIFKLRFK